MSKQAISSGIAHWVNVLLAFMLSRGHISDDCDWYFINITIDIIVGVIMCYFIILALKSIG